MSEKPVLFSAPMVRALLAGTKTQTRRVIKPQPTYIESSGRWRWPIPPAKRHGCDAVVSASREWHEYLLAHQVPWHAVGDLLWVKETFRLGKHLDANSPANCSPTYVWYTADGSVLANGRTATNAIHDDPGKTRVSIHMCQAYSRLTLKVTNVRVQRLQDISEEDALAEGVPDDWHYTGSGDEEYCSNCRGFGVHAALGAGYGVTEVDCSECETARLRYRNLWEHINGPGSWEKNPWVAAYTFEVLKQNIAEVAP